MKRQLLPASVFLVGLVVFGRLIWIYPPPLPDFGLMIVTAVCVSWAMERAKG